ncbi:MAG: hypothetical protein K0R63_998 [Rickettsiales bacterium]|jgi:hypothetical protein|nr:hypothetical protein [Rickettsiales bacterium]
MSKNSTSIIPSQTGAQKNHQLADPALNLAAGTLQLARVAPTFYQMVFAPILKTLGYDTKAAKNAEERKAKKETNREKIIALANERDAAKAVPTPIAQKAPPPAPVAPERFTYPPSKEALATIRNKIQNMLVDNNDNPLHTSQWAKRNPKHLQKIADALEGVAKESEIGLSMLSKFLEVGNRIVVMKLDLIKGQQPFGKYVYGKTEKTPDTVSHYLLIDSDVQNIQPTNVLHELVHFVQSQRQIADKIGGCNIAKENPLTSKPEKSAHYSPQIEEATDECDVAVRDTNWAELLASNNIREICRNVVNQIEGLPAVTLNEAIAACNGRSVEDLKSSMLTVVKQRYDDALEAYSPDAIPKEQTAYLTQILGGKALKIVCPELYKELMKDVCPERGI